MNTYQKITIAAALTCAFAWVSNDELAHDIKQAEQYRLDVCTGRGDRNRKYLEGIMREGGEEYKRIYFSYES